MKAETHRKIEQITGQLAQLQQGPAQGKCHCIHVDQLDLQVIALQAAVGVHARSLSTLE